MKHIFAPRGFVQPIRFRETRRERRARHSVIAQRLAAAVISSAISISAIYYVWRSLRG